MHNVFGSSLSVIFPNIFEAWPTTISRRPLLIFGQITLALEPLDPLACVGNSLLNFLNYNKAYKGTLDRNYLSQLRSPYYLRNLCT